MLYLKKINFEDVEEEYKAIKSMPAQENGFENKYHDVTKEEFINEVIPKLLKNFERNCIRNNYKPVIDILENLDNTLDEIFRGQTLNALFSYKMKIGIK